MEDYRRDGSLCRRYYRLMNIENKHPSLPLNIQGSGCGAVRHGQYIHYHSNGSIWSMETYNMGKNIGIELYMKDKGDIYMFKRYNDKGEENGPNYDIIRPDIICKFTNYKDGKKHGRCYVREDDTSELEEELYEDGERIYSYRHFYYRGPKIDSITGPRVNQQQSVENDRHS